jgi:WD40 repeat protein
VKFFKKYFVYMLHRPNLPNIFLFLSVIFIAWQNEVRVYSTKTGEYVRTLEDNKDGLLVGYSIDPEDKKSLVACTENGTVITWKLGSYVIGSKKVSDLS